MMPWSEPGTPNSVSGLLTPGHLILLCPRKKRFRNRVDTPAMLSVETWKRNQPPQAFHESFSPSCCSPLCSKFPIADDLSALQSRSARQGESRGWVCAEKRLCPPQSVPCAILGQFPIGNAQESGA